MKRQLLALALAGLVATGLAPAVGAARFSSQIDLPVGWQPEGVTSGPGTTLFVGSVATGAVWAGDARSGTGDVLVEGQPNWVAVGVEYEQAADRLWVAGGPTGRVTAYDARTGAQLRSYDFSVSTPSFVNDLVATRDAILATDSMNQRLLVVPLGRGHSLPDPGAAFSLPISGDLVYEAGFNANGIVADDGQLLVIQSNTGELFRVDPATGASTRVDLPGNTATTGPLVNGDGLELLGSTLFVVRNQNNVIQVVSLGPQDASGELRSQIANAGFDVPTTAALAAGRLWVVSARFGSVADPTTAEYWLTRVP